MKNILTLFTLFFIPLVSFGQSHLGSFPEQLRVCPCEDTANSTYEMFRFKTNGSAKYSQIALIKCPGDCEDHLYGLRGDIEDGLWTRISPAISSFSNEDMEIYEHGAFFYIFSGKKYYRYLYKENSFAKRSKAGYMRDCRNDRDFLCRH